MSSSQLQRELGKKQPFSSPEQGAILNIVRTNEQFSNRFGRMFREYDLTGSQYNVLRILRGEGKPMQCQEIVERMLHVVPAVTGLVDRLESRGLVHRKRSTEDRRVVYVELTKKAVTLLKKIDRPLEKLHHELIGHLSPTELKQLSRLLEKARRSLALAES